MPGDPPFILPRSLQMSTTVEPTTDLPVDRRPRSLTVLGALSLIGGALGWWASLHLLMDYIDSLKDSSFVPSCNLSAVVNCAQNFSSGYGSIFGFSNTAIGLTLFTIPIVLGVLILSGMRFPQRIFLGYSFGLLGGIVLISYLQHASFFDLKTLCLYCLLIWSVTIPLFWASLSASLRPAEVVLDEDGEEQSRGILGIIAENWWLFALVHLAAVLAIGEFSIGAMSNLMGIIFG